MWANSIMIKSLKAKNILAEMALATQPEDQARPSECG